MKDLSSEDKVLFTNGLEYAENCGTLRVFFKNLLENTIRTSLKKFRLNEENIEELLKSIQSNDALNNKKETIATQQKSIYASTAELASGDQINLSLNTLLVNFKTQADLQADEIKLKQQQQEVDMDITNLQSSTVVYVQTQKSIDSRAEGEQ